MELQITALDAGHLEIKGPDAADFLHRMTSNDILKLPVLQGAYDALLDRKGMVLSLFYLLRLATDHFLLITPPNLTQKTFEKLSQMKFRAQFTLTNISEERGLVWVVGPQADHWWTEKFSHPPLTANQIMPLEDATYAWKEEIFGPPVYPISMKKENISLITSHRDDQNIRLLKMKVGFPEYGVDIDETHLLLEIKTPIAYQRNKGCYPGQEVVERILAYGKGKTPKTLCALSMVGEHPIAKDTLIFAPTGEKAGVISSSLYDPLQQKTFLIACLTHKYMAGAVAAHQEGDRIILG